MDNTNEMTLTPIGGQVMSQITLETQAEQAEHPNFIEANTSGITLEELSQHIVPTFGDGTLTLSSCGIINATMKAAREIFGDLTEPEIRVSHKINGRKPDAIHKATSELTPEDTTTFYQRVACLARVKNLTRVINGSEVHLCVGATRSYAEDKLWGKVTPCKMRLFVGWFVKVCSNGCLTTDGCSGVIDVLSEADVYEKALALFGSYDPLKEETLSLLENLANTRISESTFCQLVGRCRLYAALSSEEQSVLPKIVLGDQAMNKVVYGFKHNPNFALKEGENSISLWELCQLCTEAVKSSYIDLWIERNQAAVDFCLGIQRALLGEDEEGYDWFIN